jgi:hypothetical protein
VNRGCSFLITARGTESRTNARPYIDSVGKLNCPASRARAVRVSSMHRRKGSRKNENTLGKKGLEFSCTTHLFPLVNRSNDFCFTVHPIKNFHLSALPATENVRSCNSPKFALPLLLVNTSLWPSFAFPLLLITTFPCGSFLPLLGTSGVLDS